MYPSSGAVSLDQFWGQTSQILSTLSPNGTAVLEGCNRFLLRNKYEYYRCRTYYGGTCHRTLQQ